MKTLNQSPPRRRRARKSADLFQALIVDYFAGAGGASLGIEQAMGRSVDVAVNHDEAAIVMHLANHPHCHHVHQDVFQADPVKVTGGKPVGIFWASPDCRHFSRAKGTVPVKKKIRGLAWAVVRFVDRLKPANRPQIIFLENVREFEGWGPLVHAKSAKGKPLFTDHGEPVLIPDHSRKGETFRKFVRRLRSYGYHVEWRPLNAADYGAPTHRRRLFLVARRDGKPIRWPAPTHGPKSPKRRKYRAAAECIDWERPCPSIFMGRNDARELAKETGIRCNRPLRPKTMSRIAHGLVRYVINAKKPFIVTCNHGGPEFRGHSTAEPFNTLTASRDAHGLVSPFLVKYYGQGCGSPADGPVHTVTTKDRCAVTTPYLVRANHGSKHFRGQRVDQPACTLTGSKTAAAVQPVLSPFLVSRYGEGPHQKTRGQKVDEPIGTVTPKNNSGTLVQPALAPFISQFFGGMVGKSADDPLPTVTSIDHNGAVAAFLARIGQYGGNGKFTNDARDPLSTVVSKNEHMEVAASLLKFRGGSSGSAATDPMPTITGGGKTARPAGAAHALGTMAAYLTKFNTQKGNESRCHSADEPLRTLDTQNRFGPVAAYLVHMNHGEKQWSAADEPQRTITSGNHAAAVEAYLSELIGPAVWAAFNHVYSFLLEYVGPDAPLPIVVIDGHVYLIVDIGMRMLIPRELARAQGFDEDYVLTGTAAQQVAKIGNSVSPPAARALVYANCCEEAGVAA